MYASTRRRRVVRLGALQRLAAREPQRGVGEHADRLGVAGRRELRERAREEVVAGRARGVGAVDRPGRRLAAAEVRAVDQVVVDERRHVHELDGDAGGERRVAPRRRREEDEQRAQPLAAGGERLVADGRDEAGMARDGAREPLLERVEVLLEPVGRRGSPRAVLASSRFPDVQRDDTAGEEAVADVGEAVALEQPGERVRAREAAHARGQVRVRRRRPAAPCRAAARCGRTRRGRTARAGRAAS